MLIEYVNCGFISVLVDALEKGYLIAYLLCTYAT